MASWSLTGGTVLCAAEARRRRTHWQASARSRKAKTAKPSSGRYRRRIRLTSRGPSEVGGELVDDFHHFRVVLRHDGEHVSEVDGEAIRYPWTTCPGAVEPLRALMGMPLARSATAARSHTDVRMNCTHLFDLAGLAVAHAAAGREVRQYDATVPDRRHGRTRAVLHRDGEPCLEWELDRQTITAPEPFAGVALRGSFLAWVQETFADEDMAEAAGVLRRACEISFGRGVDLDAVGRASELGEMVVGSCHSFQPGTIDQAVRVKGTTLDFSVASPEL